MLYCWIVYTTIHRVPITASIYISCIKIMKTRQEHSKLPQVYSHHEKRCKIWYENLYWMPNYIICWKARETKTKYEIIEHVVVFFFSWATTKSMSLFQTKTKCSKLICKRSLWWTSGERGRDGEREKVKSTNFDHSH